MWQTKKTTLPANFFNNKRIFHAFYWTVYINEIKPFDFTILKVNGISEMGQARIFISLYESKGKTIKKKLIRK